MQPKTPTVSYYQPPPLFPLTLPLVLGIVAVLFASYGSGTLADWFRGKIIDTFGPGMIPGARWFAIIMVRGSYVSLLVLPCTHCITCCKELIE